MHISSLPHFILPHFILPHSILTHFILPHFILAQWDRLPVEFMFPSAAQRERFSARLRALVVPPARLKQPQVGGTARTCGQSPHRCGVHSACSDDIFASRIRSMGNFLDLNSCNVFCNRQGDELTIFTGTMNCGEKRPPEKVGLTCHLQPVLIWRSI